MTALELQEQLGRELENIFKDMVFKAPTTAGFTMKKGINVYDQWLPVRGNTEDELEPAPYIIVRLDNGNTENYESSELVQMLLIIMIYDDDRSNIGQKTVLNVIHKIKQRFEKEPLLADMFLLDKPIDWALQDEETYPYYIGAVNMKWKVHAIRKEADSYS